MPDLNAKTMPHMYGSPLYQRRTVQGGSTKNKPGITASNIDLFLFLHGHILQ